MIGSGSEPIIGSSVEASRKHTYPAVSGGSRNIAVAIMRYGIRANDWQSLASRRTRGKHLWRASQLGKGGCRAIHSIDLKVDCNGGCEVLGGKSSKSDKNGQVEVGGVWKPNYNDSILVEKSGCSLGGCDGAGGGELVVLRFRDTFGEVVAVILVGDDSLGDLG
ncbi:hypothetical protein Tco_0071063 [Tanacetum coccineum]